jgi:hypothetical protein
MGYFPLGYSPPQQLGGTFTVNPLGALFCSVINKPSLVINSNPSGYKKRKSPGSIKFISTFISEERG